MTELQDLNRFIESTYRVESDDDLLALLSELTQTLGFDYVSLFRRDMVRPEAMVALSNYPRHWLDIVQDRRYFVTEPVYVASRRTAVGFRRDQIGQYVALNELQREIMREAEDAGLADWFAVPAHVGGEASGLATFVVADGKPLPEAKLPLAQLAGSFAFEAARRLHQGRELKKLPDPVALSPRQLDCLVLVARGKTDWEIANILGIAEDTVGKYMDDARRRYDVTKRSQLLVRALYDGHFSLADAIG